MIHGATASRERAFAADLAERFDVVVAGCGVAGLSAAASAQEAGARVLVVERAPQDERGGNTRYTEAYADEGSFVGYG